MENLEGTLLKGYKLGERIGNGGFGAVYRAKQPTIEREVAVKIILPGYANNPDFIRRFESEAHVIARLEHLHITPLYDFWRDPEGAYLVMRYLKGGSVRDTLESSTYELNAVYQLLDQIASALDFAHRNNVIHRDIKPGNILLDEDGNAYLADFGIAKDLAGLTDNKTAADAVVGSLDYISPEQARSEPVTPRTDIYSLGVTVYEMITGEHPFKNTSSVERLYKHINDPLPAILNLPDDMGDTINDIIAKATAKNPQDRYPDVLALAVAFREGIGRSASQQNESIVEQLTMREHEILALITSNMSNREIADELVVTLATVKWHITQLYKKLGVRSRVQAIVRARELNLIVNGNTADNLPALSDQPASISLPEPENPYKGLHAFQMIDARDFFGRDDLTQKLIDRMVDDDPYRRFLAIVGPSGSGKSSLVKAGLIPALWKGAINGSEKWFVVDMIPGTHPLDKLETALIRVSANQTSQLREQLQRDERGLLRVADIILPGDETELVIVVDQFEEVFTLVEDEETRQHFLNLLRIAVSDVRSRVRVVVTLRADYYDRPLHYPEFGELIRNRMETVLPLSAKGLERAVRGPAERVGVTFEQGLVEQIVSQMNYQAGALPLLQYALTELFDRREGRLLTNQAYQQIGGAVGALANRADEIYRGLTEDGQELAHQMFMRLVTLGEGAEDTRRRALHTELLSLTDNRDLMEEIIDQFTAYRLLSLDHDPETRQPTVEVAHEAILREWERLRAWLNESRNDIRLQNQIASLVSDWKANNKDNSYLLRGTRLEQLESWSVATDIVLTPDEKTYIDASIKLRNRQAADELERRQREQQLEDRSKRFLRILTVGSVFAAVIAIGLSVFAFTQQQNAQRERNTALRQADVNQSLVLAGDATDAYVKGDTELALMLALEAVNIEDPPLDSIRSLVEVARGTGTRAVLSGHTDEIRSLAISPDNRFIASGSCAELAEDVCQYGEFNLWDLEQSNVIWQVDESIHQGWITDVAFSPDAALLLVASDDGRVALWNVSTGEVELQITGHDGAVNAVAYHPDGESVATAGVDGLIHLWDVATGDEIRTFVGHGDNLDMAEDEENVSIAVNDIVFNLDGRELLSGSDDTTAILWDTATGDIIQIYEQFNEDAIGIEFVAFDYTNSQIHAQNTQNMIWDKTTAGAPQLIIVPLRISGLAVGIDSTVYHGLHDYVLFAYPNTGATDRFLYDHDAIVLQVDLSGDNRLLVSGDADGIIRVWNLNAQRIQEIALPAPASGSFLRLSPDESSLLVGASEAGLAFIVDIETGDIVHQFEGDYALSWAVGYSPDGRYAAVGYIDFYTDDNANHLVMYDTETGDVVHELVGHNNRISDVEFTPDGRYLLSSSQNFALEGEIIVWDVETGELVRRFDNDRNIASIDITSDGVYVVSSSFFDQAVAVWDMETGTKLRQQEFDSLIYTSILTADDSRMLLGFLDGSMLEIDVETLETVRRFEGHTGEVWDITLSRDGQLIASGQSGGIAILWDYNTGLEIGRFAQSGGFQTNVAFGPDDSSVFTSAYRNTVIEWQTGNQSLDDLLTWVEDNRYLRDLTCEERFAYNIEPLCDE